MLFETGQPSRALDPLRRAVTLAPDEAQIRVLYAQALVAVGGNGNLNEAITQLSRVVQDDPTIVRAYVFLGQAHEQLGQRGEATLAGAEAALARGDPAVARGLARQAQQYLANGSPEWWRADDILNVD
jgi:predicted Zn-dependent protease